MSNVSLSSSHSILSMILQESKYNGNMLTSALMNTVSLFLFLSSWSTFFHQWLQYWSSLATNCLQWPLDRYLCIGLIELWAETIQECVQMNNSNWGSTKTPSQKSGKSAEPSFLGLIYSRNIYQEFMSLSVWVAPFANMLRVHICITFRGQTATERSMPKGWSQATPNGKTSRPLKNRDGELVYRYVISICSSTAIDIT